MDIQGATFYRAEILMRTAERTDYSLLYTNCKLLVGKLIHEVNTVQAGCPP
jgi:hypothetical protein